jgi:uncharacterized protein RhaS with RHS repeats
VQRCDIREKACGSQCLPTERTSRACTERSEHEQLLVGRYYDPGTGQFLTVDPMVQETGQPYAYTEDDPVNGVDPLGLEDGNPIDPIGADAIGLSVSPETAADESDWAEHGGAELLQTQGIEELNDGYKGCDIDCGNRSSESENSENDVKECESLENALNNERVALGAPANHLNGAMAEELGWQASLSDGEIGIQGPGKVTANGPDYITWDPDSDTINVWDAKYSSSGRYSSGVPSAQLNSWYPQIQSAVADYSGPGFKDVQEAFINGNVVGRIFPYGGG